MNIITHHQGSKRHFPDRCRQIYLPFLSGYFHKTLGNIAYERGDVFHARRFFTMAMELFEQALDTDPNNADTLCNMGQVLFALLSSRLTFAFRSSKCCLRARSAAADCDRRYAVCH
jgi:tetratricopeptide (TPR) repeat protein